MYVISVNEQGQNTRLVIGCADQAEHVMTKLTAFEYKPIISPADDVPERDDAEKARAQHVLQRISTH